MDSDDLSTDENIKRKREEDKDVDLFAKSKKTVRTPIKSSKSSKESEEKLDKILALLSQQGETIQDLRKEVRQIRMEQKEYSDEIKKLREENASIKEENEAIKEELQDIKETVEFLEKARKKNNVMMNGLPMESNDSTVLKERINSFLKEHLEININVTYVTKIGEKACVVELSNEHDKSKVMLNKSKLKDLKTEKVYINDDLTKKEREKQRQIRKTAQEEKSKGNVVKIGYNKIIINGTEWRWNNKTEKLERTKSKN